MRRALASLLSCLVAWPAVAAVSPRSGSPPGDDAGLEVAVERTETETISRQTLPNGARLIVQPRPGCGTFALEMLAEGGTMEDDASRYGLSPVLARMLLRGTASRTTAQQSLDVERTGSTVQPASGPAALGLRASGPAAAFGPVMEVVADAARAPRLADEDVAREVALERQALRGALDDPATAFERALRPAVFPGHPLGRVADPERYLAGVDAAALRRAHADRFTGSRLVLVIVGDIAPGEALERGREALASFQPGVPRAAQSSPHMLTRETREQVNRRTTQPLLFVGVPTAGLGPAEWPVMDLLMEVLAGYQERIYTEIRDRRGWAYWVRGEDRRYRDAGLFGIVTAVPTRRLEEAESIIRRELERIASAPPAPDEIERALRLTLTEQARAWQRSAARAATFAWRETRGLPPATYGEQDAALRAVSASDVSALARRLLAASRLAVVTLR